MDAFQIVAEPRRRQILALVWKRELSAGDIASHFEVTFGAVSQHLGILRNAGLVTVRSDGNRRLYRADRQRLGPLRPIIESMWTESLDRLAEAIARDEASPEQS